ncbi:MAG: hypothetical protein K2X91_12560 [Thermoleophilia bacterium]|nr:hypothetical protein [Thermoleophilia bacterium]
MEDWPFADPPNLASITVRQVVHDGQPVLLVVHDAHDGGWQFLTGGVVDVADGLVVSLAGMVARDRSLADLADLPRGWRAWRSGPGAPWQRGPREADG